MIEDGLQLLFFLLLLFLTVPLLGRYMAGIFNEEAKKSIPILTQLEKLTYRLCQIDPNEEMTWQVYAKALLFFNLNFFVCFDHDLLIHSHFCESFFRL